MHDININDYDPEILQYAVYPSKEYFIREFLINGKSRKQLAEENNVTEATIKTHLYEKQIKKNTNRISRGILERLYVTEGKSITQISKLTGLSEPTVSAYLKKFDIIHLGPHYANNIYNDTNDGEYIKLYQQGLSLTEIARRFNTTSTMVSRHIKNYGINIRSNIYNKNINTILPLTPTMRNIMIDLHHNQRLSLGVIGDMYHCYDIKYVIRYFNGLNIPIFSQTNAYLAPPTLYPTKHNFETSVSQRARHYCQRYLNPLAIKRDDYKCRYCGSNERLNVHHSFFSFHVILDTFIYELHSELSVVDNIDELYNLLIHEPVFLDLDNLITLCNACHTSLHSSLRNPNYFN